MYVHILNDRIVPDRLHTVKFEDYLTSLGNTVPLHKQEASSSPAGKKVGI